MIQFQIQSMSMTHFDLVSVKRVKTANGAGKLRPPPRNLFNQQMPGWELSPDCCQSLHQGHFVFRGKDMWLDDLATGSWIFFYFYFFLKDQEAEKWVYICLVQAPKTCELQSEPAHEIFGILLQHIKAALIRDSPSAGPRIALWSPLHTLQFIRKKKKKLVEENQNQQAED